MRSRRERKSGRMEGGRVGLSLASICVVFFHSPILPASAAAESALVRLVPPSTNVVWIGERVTFSVELLIQGQFSGPTYFDVPEVEGAIVMRPAERPLLGSKTVSGESYVAQTHEFVLFAQRPGERIMPAITARFASKERFDRPAVEHRLSTAPFQVKALAPAGSRPGDVVVTTTEFAATQTWSPQPSPAKVGDAFTRLIRLRATGVPGMLLPPLGPSAIDGLAAYPKPPQLQDRTERGEFTGERSESVTYVCERAGRFEIPEIVIRWWNPKSQDWIEERFPAVTLEVAENPALAGAGQAKAIDALRPAAPTTGRRAFLWILLTLLGALAVFGPWMIRRLRTARQQWTESEPAHFARLLRACRRSEAPAVDRAFRLWLGRWDHSRGALAGLWGDASAPSCRQEWLRLQRRLAGLESGWHGGALSRQFRRLRRELRVRSREEKTGGLAPLNPLPGL